MKKEALFLKKSANKIQLAKKPNEDFALQEKSITLVYLNYNLELIQKKVYTDQNWEGALSMNVEIVEGKIENIEELEELW